MFDPPIVEKPAGVRVIGFRVQGIGFRVLKLYWFRVIGFRVQGIGFRVLKLYWFRVLGFKGF
jgi:hypothetical protein